MSAETLSPDLEYYISKLHPQYDSADEAEIGRMLDQYGIPFFYREPMLICENGRRKIWRPDFTLPTYNNMVIEYNPNDGHTAGAKSKSNVYRQNSITALFLDQSYLARPDWQQRLYEQLDKIYRHPLAYLSDKSP